MYSFDGMLAFVGSASLEAAIYSTLEAIDQSEAANVLFVEVTVGSRRN
jgi:hypothetical protein